MNEKSSESEHAVNDTSCAWNRCPTCGELVDVDGCVDGSEMNCPACNARLVLTEYVDDTFGLLLADDSEEDEPDGEPDWTPEARARARLAVDVATGKTQAVACGNVTITAPDGMTLGEVWAAIKSSPALRVCLDAELRQARESARGTTPAELETARRDIRAAVLEDAFRAGVDHAKAEHEALTAEISRLRTRDARIPSLDQLDALLAKHRAQSHGEPIDLLGAIQTAEARIQAAYDHADPNVRRFLLLDCAAWALSAVCEIDGAQASAPVAVTREANDEGSGP